LPDWLIALLPLAGVVVGAALQYVLGGLQARSTRRMEAKIEVYAGYLEALDTHNLAQRENSEKLQQARKALLIAKTRMTIYASEPVVRAAANLHRDWKAQEKFRESLIDLCEAMRNDTRGRRDTAARADLDELLWGATKAPSPADGQPVTQHPTNRAEV
jgi:hypothetical protein